MACHDWMRTGAAVALSLWVLSGCGEEKTNNVLGGSSASGTPLEGGIVPEDGPCSTGSTQACECDPDDAGVVRSGTRNCYQGRWFECHCSVDLGPAPSLDGECRAGRYEGDFSGLYSSAYTAVGFPIPVFALDPLQPGLAFTLNQTSQGASQEFNFFTISDGYVKGTANGLFPFEGVLTGTLDCGTKTFTGTLTGGYCVGPCVAVNEGKFEGPITGRYDSNGFKFTSGTWDLVEDAAFQGLFSEFGGSGQWSATWVGAGSVDLDSGVTTAADAGI